MPCRKRSRLFLAIAMDWSTILKRFVGMACMLYCGSLVEQKVPVYEVV